MSAPAHTPGPWAVEYEERESGHVIRMGEAIETPWSFPSEQVIRYDHTISPDDDDEREQFAIAEANARLIAAAPELLEALAKLERTVVALYRAATPHGNYGANTEGSDLNESAFADKDPAVLQARAAIAKARGTNPTQEVSHVG